MALNASQQRFVQEYLVDQNATKAAERAGYSKRTAGQQGHELLKNPEIKDQIQKGLDKLKADAEKRAKDKNIISKEQWLSGLVEIAFADIDRYVTVGSDGRPKLIPTAERPKGSGRLIRKISVSAQGTVTLELHQKTQAIELLGKHFGWVKDHLEHSGGIDTGSPQMGVEELKQIHGDPETRKLARELALRLSQPKKEEGE